MFIPIGNYKWGDELDTRKKRLQVLTGIGHEYSLMVGADCPLGNVQQVRVMYTALPRIP